MLLFDERDVAIMLNMRAITRHAGFFAALSMPRAVTHARRRTFHAPC